MIFDVFRIYEQTILLGKYMYGNVSWNLEEATELKVYIDHLCNSARPWIKTSEYSYHYKEEENGNDLGLRQDQKTFKHLELTLNIESETYKEKIKPFLYQVQLCFLISDLFIFILHDYLAIECK